MASNPSSQNAFQRYYFAWAQPYHQRMPQPLRHEVECLDRWLYSRAGARFWLILVAASLLGVVSLHALGLSWPVAMLGSFGTAISVVIVALGAWLVPTRYTPFVVLKFAVPGMVAGWLSMAGLDVVDRAIEPGGLDLAKVWEMGGRTATRALPAMLVVMALMTLLVSIVASIRRLRVRREVAALRVARERETTARELAEARLRLLQGRIQPSFVFDTLAAVQGWVDVADPRAGPLLRALTSFLRGSTELLTQTPVPLAIELATVRDYLAILAARLGDRLRVEVHVDARAAARDVPPGFLLTLVENAIEHGISPTLHGGTVTIDVAEDAEHWRLTVTHDGAGLPPSWTEGVGLRNCRARLAHHFGPGASLVLVDRRPGARATLRIDVASFA